MPDTTLSKWIWRGSWASRQKSPEGFKGTSPSHSLLTNREADRAAGLRVPCHDFSPQREEK